MNNVTIGNQSDNSPNVRLSDKAYFALEKMILTLELPPGQLLNEGQLASQLGVGRTPLREAIQRLTAHKLLTVVPRRGTLVTPLSVKDLLHVYEFRVELEAFAARLAAMHATNQDIEAMEAILKESVPTAEHSSVVVLDQQMHKLIAQAAGNDYLAETLAYLYPLSIRLWHLLDFERETIEELRAEHEAIVTAIRNRDVEAADRSARNHILIRLERVIRLRGSTMRAFPDIPTPTRRQ